MKKIYEINNRKNIYIKNKEKIIKKNMNNNK